MMNEFRCWIFMISDKTGNFSVQILGWENFPSEDQRTGNPQSLQSGAIILQQRDTIESAQRGHSLIEVTGGGSDTDIFTWRGHSS